MKIVHVEEPIYNTKVTICQCPLSDFNAYIKKNFKTDLSSKPAAGHFYATAHDKTGIEHLFVWFSKYEEMTLLHECLHCAVWAMESRGVEITSDNDEAFVYYTEWLFRTIKQKIVK